MTVDNLDFSKSEDITEFVGECEQKYTSDVQKACALCIDSGRIITLCGPTCSGKTTTALILDDEFKARGKELHTISIDDFYFDCDKLAEMSRKSGTPLDYDSPSTIDIEFFSKVVKQIENGDTVTLPKFDFKKGCRIGTEDISIKDDDIFLFEGIQAVYPSLTEHLKGHAYTSLFISVENGFDAFGVTLSPRELRFCRRLVRDARTRGASAEFTFSLWESVAANEDKNIYPNLKNVDFKINSMLSYEPYVIKPFLIPLLEGLSKDSIYKDEANALIKRVQSLPTIDQRFVPENSVFREFIGERT